MTECYIYAFDTNDKKIVAALPCEGIIEACGACEKAKDELRKSELEHGTLRFGIAKLSEARLDIEARQVIEIRCYGIPCPSRHDVPVEDFETAAKHTQDLLLKTPPPDNLPVAIKFIRLANMELPAIKYHVLPNPFRTNTPAEPHYIGNLSVVSAVNADYPRQIQAASGRGTSDILYGETEDIEPPGDDEPPVNMHDKTVHAAIKELTAAIKEPQPVYLVDSPKDATLEPQDCPLEGQGGYWESQSEYAKRNNLTTSTLTQYRESRHNPRLSKDGTWGIDKTGNVFKKKNNKPNSPFLYFVKHKK